MNRYKLTNGIDVVIKNNKNTPRTAIVLYIKIEKDETKAGLYYLITQLLFQGTKNRTSAKLAEELDENAIDLLIEKKTDYIRVKLLGLNEDVEYALDILGDIIENSTFEDLEKEKIKIKGEFEADLDSAKIQAQDEYYRTIFENHPYGIGRKEIIKQIDTINKKDLVEAYNEIKYCFAKNISVAGDYDEEKLIKLLNKNLNFLKTEKMENKRKLVEELTENKLSVICKEDANQAQIFQGWLVPSVYSDEYASIIVLNTILGFSGLSSRLFMELREKQGLAYTVRSVYEPFKLKADFFVYIATEPKNIRTCLEGFEKEINKIVTELISDEELENAKNNAIGKRQFYKETNLLEASLNGYYEFLGLGFNFEEKLIDRMKNITKNDIIKAAEICFSKPNALCILAPEKYLKEAELL